MRRRMLMDLIFGGDSVKYEGTFTGNGTQDCNLTGIACQVPEVMLCHF